MRQPFDPAAGIIALYVRLTGPKSQSIECLGKRLDHIQVLCHSLPAESPVDGLLGLNFLSRFDLHLLFRQKYLHLE